MPPLVSELVSEGTSGRLFSQVQSETIASRFWPICSRDRHFNLIRFRIGSRLFVWCNEKCHDRDMEALRNSKTGPIQNPILHWYRRKLVELWVIFWVLPEVHFVHEFRNQTGGGAPALRVYSVYFSDEDFY